jgi:hypothetical protein
MISSVSGWLCLSSGWLRLSASPRGLFLVDVTPDASRDHGEQVIRGEAEFADG